MTRIAASFATVLFAACATTLQDEARRAAETGIDPAPLVAELQTRYAEIDATKRIFSVTLIEGRRRFAGDGAIEYRADPKTLKADVFGPHDTPVVHVRLAGEMLTMFRALRIDREAIAAVYFLQRAAAARNVSVALLAELASYLRRAREEPGLVFEPSSG